MKMTQNILPIYIGYDEVESVAWHTAAQSIIEKSSIPISIIPVRIEHFRNFFTRDRDPKQSNSFSFSRFCVPYLNKFSDYAVFMDCDMMLRCDIAEVFNEVQNQPGKAVYVVQHDYTPSEKIKYLNTVQYAYPRKNWSSFVLWDCGHIANRSLTPDFFNTATGLELHRFTWLKDEEIGELNVRWNWLVGDYKDPPEDVRNVHWTNGGPYFSEYQNCDFSHEWQQMHKKINHCDQRD